MKKLLIILVIVIAAGVGFWIIQPGNDISDDYVNPKADLIRPDIEPNMEISSPLVLTGEARGFWFFEASFPVTLEDANGNVLIHYFATAQGEWMTEEFVPFESTLTFNKPGTSTGRLIFHRDNPSGLPENDDQLVIPVIFK